MTLRLAANEAEATCVHCGWTRRVKGRTAREASLAVSAQCVEHRREKHGRTPAKQPSPNR